MPFQDLVEGSRLAPTLALTFGIFESKTARFHFRALDPQSRGPILALASKDATFQGNNATCQSDNLPDVPDGLEHYQVTVVADSHGRTTTSNMIYRVWPAYIDVELVPVDGAGVQQQMASIAFTTSQGGPTTARQTNAVTGVLRVGGLQLRDIEVRVPGPPVIKRWVTNTATVGRLRKAEVQTTFEAGFLAPLSGAKITQLVNRATADEGRDGKGRIVTIKVGGKGDGARLNDQKHALRNAYVYIKCTFSKTTARNDVSPALTDVLDHTSTDGGKVQKGRVRITGDDKLATFKVNLGLAGGETCKVEIGSAPDVVTDTLDFENWREVEYELLQPTADGDARITDFTYFRSRTEAGLSDDALLALKACLDPVFVKLTERRKAFYLNTDLAADGAHNVLDGAALSRTGGQRILVLTSRQALDIIDAKMQHKDARTVSVLATDFVASPAQLDRTFTCTAETVITLVDKQQALPRALDGSNTGGVAQGAFFVSRLRWKAVKFQSAGEDEDGFGHFQELIANDTHPGWAHRDWTEIADPVDIQAHIEIVSPTQIRFKLPSNKATFPGQCFPVDGFGQLTKDNATIEIEVQMQGVCVRVPLGQATAGLVILTTSGGATHHAGIARVFAHELGHDMGQSYGGKTLDASFGRTSPIPGIPFPAVVPDGDIYTEHGHRGLHCAKGLTNKAALTFDYLAVDTEHTCVMFGQANPSSATVYQFCDDCKTYIRAENLDNIRKDWKA